MVPSNPLSRQLERSYAVLVAALYNSMKSARGVAGLYMISLMTMRSCGGSSVPVKVTASEAEAPDTVWPLLFQPWMFSELTPGCRATRSVHAVTEVQVGWAATPLTVIVATPMGAVPDKVMRLRLVLKVVGPLTAKVAATVASCDAM